MTDLVEELAKAMYAASAISVSSKGETWVATWEDLAKHDFLQDEQEGILIHAKAALEWFSKREGDAAQRERERCARMAEGLAGRIRRRE